MSKSSLNAGALDQRVSLLRPVYENEFQDEISGYTEAGRAWASIQPTVAVEVGEAGRTVERVTVLITIRYRTDLDQRWRIGRGVQVWEIQGIVNPLNRNERLDLSCREVI